MYKTLHSLTKEAKTYNGIKTVSSINGAGKIEQIDYFLIPCTRINSKWVK